MYGTTNATAQVYSPPLRPPRRERESVRRRLAGRPTSMTDVPFICWSPLSRLLVFGEDLLDALECLVDRDFRFHSFLRHVDHRQAAHVLGADFRHRQVEHVVVRHGRAEEALLDVASQMRVLRVLPEWALGERRHDWQPAAQPQLDELADDFRLGEVLDEFLRHRDVLRPLRDHQLGDADDARYGLARIVVRIADAVGHHVLEVPLRVLLLDRNLGRERPVDIHHHELGVEGVVVVRVIPVDRARRHVAVAIGAAEVSGRLDGRLLDLRVVEMQLAVPGDDVLTAIGQEKRHEEVVGIDPVGRHLEAQAVYLALALLAQVVLHLLEEVEIRVPRLWDVLDLETGFLYQRSPDMAWDDRGPYRHTVLANLLRDVVVGLTGHKSGLAVLGRLQLHDVADVDPPVLPGVYL